MDATQMLGFLGHMARIMPLFQPDNWTQVGFAGPTRNNLIGNLGIRLFADTTEVELGITLASNSHGKGHGLRTM